MTSRLIAGCRWNKKWFLVCVRELHLPSSRWTESQTVRAERKNHSQFHYDTLTWPEQKVRPWMWCLDAASTIVGVSKETEVHQMRGLDSHGSPYWIKNFQMDLHGPGSGWQRSKQHPGPNHLWSAKWKIMSDAAQRREKQKWAIEKTEAWRRQKIARYLLYWSSRCGVQGFFQKKKKKRTEKVGSSDASSNALQDQGKNVQGNLSHSWYSQDKNMHASL